MYMYIDITYAFHKRRAQSFLPWHYSRNPPDPAQWDSPASHGRSTMPGQAPKHFEGMGMTIVFAKKKNVVYQPWLPCSNLLLSSVNGASSTVQIWELIWVVDHTLPFGELTWTITTFNGKTHDISMATFNSYFDITREYYPELPEQIGPR